MAKLQINVLEARNLIAKDSSGTSDPFVRLSFNGQVFKSPVIKKNLNPRWTKDNCFIFTDVRDNSALVEVSVYDWDRIGKDDLIGALRVEVASLEPFASMEKWLTLSGPGAHVGRSCGEIKLKMSWAPELRVHVVGARNLTPADSNGYSDPYCVVTLGSTLLKTGKKDKTLNPRWDEKFSFTGSQCSPKGPNKLKFRVQDWDRFSDDDPLGSFEISLDEIPYSAVMSGWYRLTGSGAGQGDINLKIEWYPLSQPVAGRSQPQQPQQQPQAQPQPGQVFQPQPQGQGQAFDVYQPIVAPTAPKQVGGPSGGSPSVPQRSQWSGVANANHIVQSQMQIQQQRAAQLMQGLTRAGMPIPPQLQQQLQPQPQPQYQAKQVGSSSIIKKGTAPQPQGYGAGQSAAIGVYNSRPAPEGGYQQPNRQPPPQPQPHTGFPGAYQARPAPQGQVPPGQYGYGSGSGSGAGAGYSGYPGTVPQGVGAPPPPSQVQVQAQPQYTPASYSAPPPQAAQPVAPPVAAAVQPIQPNAAPAPPPGAPGAPVAGVRPWNQPSGPPPPPAGEEPPPY